MSAAHPIAGGSVPLGSGNAPPRKGFAMKPLQPVAPSTRIVLGIGFFVLFVALWAAITFGGVVPKTFLADPLTMVASGWTLPRRWRSSCILKRSAYGTPL